MTEPARTPDLAVILADIAEEATLLEHNNAGFSVARVRELMAEVREASEEWLLWLSETDAAVRCGYTAGWLRSRFPAWQREGHARISGRVRQYRACVVPRRANTGAAAAAGRAAARQVRKSA